MSIQKTIAIVTPEFPLHTNWGGVARFNENLGNLLTKLGHDVHIFTYGNTTEYSNCIFESGTLHCIPRKTTSKVINTLYYCFPVQKVLYLVKSVIPKTFFILEWNFFCFFYYKAFSNNRKIHAVHCTSYHPSALLIKLFFRDVKLINHVQGVRKLLNMYEKDTLDDRISTWIEYTYLVRTSDIIVCCSNETKKRIADSLASVKKKLIHIPNFIDKRVYKSSKKINLNNIVFMGRLEYRKGIDLLIKSFAHLAKKNRKIHLYCMGEVGSGFGEKMNEDFSNFYDSLTIEPDIIDRISFLPRIDDKTKLIDKLNSIKGIAVFPSRYEPFGLVTIEAMALGYIVIAGNKGGGREIIQHNRNGFLTSPTVSSITSTLQKAINLDDRTAKIMGRNAMISVKNHYSNQTVKNEYESLYNF